VRATESPTPWWQTSTLVDASGGVHTAFYTNQSIVYAYCPAACDDPTNWSETLIGDAGSYDSLDYPTLALDAADQPSVSYYAQHARMCLGSNGQYQILHDVWALRFATAAGTSLCYTLEMSVNPSGGGEVNASPGPNCAGGKYTAGTEVQLNASPAAGYRFDQWSGDLSGSANPTTLILSEDKSVTANFIISSGDGHETFLPAVLGRLAQ
jgi:hypothetical protein